MSSAVWLAAFITAQSSLGQTLRLPPRPPNAPTGSVFAKQIEALSLEPREDRIWREVTSGNVPDFMRGLVPVPCTGTIDGRLDTFSPYRGTRVVFDEPAELKTKIRRLLFALPNGNTIEQTFGRRLRPDDGWHYDIQHIGAQTRFLRAHRAGFDPDESLISGTPFDEKGYCYFGRRGYTQCIR